LCVGGEHQYELKLNNDRSNATRNPAYEFAAAGYPADELSPAGYPADESVVNSFRR
jgi:hypothetical protein